MAQIIDSVYNLSNINFSDHVHSLLNKGMKFIPTKPSLLTGNLDEQLTNIHTLKLTNDESNNLEGLITYDELGKTLRNMKNNKSPGFDGFTVEFF